MSIPNLTNSLIQPQNIVMNQVTHSHAIMSNVNANNGIPMEQIIEPMHQQQNNAIHQQQQQQHIVQNTPIKSLQQHQAQSSSNLDTAQVLTKPRLQDLVRDTDATLSLEEEVEEIILEYVDEFIDRCLNGAAVIAKNRQVKTIEVKDVQQFLNRNYNMWTPGFGTDELRPYKRSMTTEAHKQRLALIRKTLKKY